MDKRNEIIRDFNLFSVRRRRFEVLWWGYSPLQSNIVIGELMSFRKKYEIALTPQIASDAEKTEKITAFLEHQFDIIDIYAKLHAFVTLAVSQGTAIAKIFWDFYADGNTKGEKIVTFDTPIFKVLDIFDVYTSSYGVPIQDCRSIIHRKHLSMKELNDRIDWGVYSEANIIRRDDIYEKSIEILEHWTPDRVVTVADRRVIVRNNPNPFDHGKMPFAEGVFDPIPFEFYSGMYDSNYGSRKNDMLSDIPAFKERLFWFVKKSLIGVARLFLSLDEQFFNYKRCLREAHTNICFRDDGKIIEINPSDFECKYSIGLREKKPKYK